MTNYPWESLDELRDADATNRVREAIDAGNVEEFEDVKELIRYRCRDNARTPMQWTDGPDAGFTAGDPWLPVNPNSDEVNVESARADPDSVWHYFRDLVDLRQDHDVLVYGEYADRLPAHDRVWAYERTLGADRAVVVLNVDDEPVGVDLERVGVSARASPLLGNCPRSDAASTLRPYEARVYLD